MNIPTNLFNLTKTKLHSGGESFFKIDCDALTNDDLICIAKIISTHLTFNKVIGIPSGGLLLAEHLKQYENEKSLNLLICDDVLTTGNSMNEYYKKYLPTNPKIIGVVIFSRTLCPDWIESVFSLTI